MLLALLSQTLLCTRSTCESAENTSPPDHLLTVAFYRVKTRLQVQVKQSKSEEANGHPPEIEQEPHYNSTWDAITQIIKNDGLEGLYAGMPGSLIGVASTNFAYFYWYSVVRTLYLSSVKSAKSPGTATELSLGAVAGALAQLFTIPVAVVTTRQQTQSKHERKGLLETGRDVINSEDGWTGLWRGLKASLVLVVNPAITYGAYQRLRAVMFPGKAQLKPLEAFGMYCSSVYSFVANADCCSAWFHVKSSRNNCYSAPDCCQGWSPIQAATIAQGKALQVVCPSHGVHH